MDNTTIITAKKGLQAALFILLPLASFAKLILDIHFTPTSYHWDFDDYYRCTKIFFSHPDFASAQTAKLLEAYNYPPLSFLVFKPLTGFEYATASDLYLLCKLAIFGMLCLIWHRHYLKNRTPVLYFPLFVLLSFYGALPLDFRAGNFSVFEQLLLWFGFAFFLVERYAVFAALIVVASFFKLWPALFLGLVLFTSYPRKWMLFILASFAVLAILGSSYLYSPGMFRIFVHNALQRTGESSYYNPSVLPMLRDVLILLRARHSIQLPEIIPQVAFAAWVSFVLWKSHLSWKKFLSNNRSLSARDRNFNLVLLSCFVYALIQPRFKDYAYLVLIVPAYWTLHQLRLSQKAILICALTASTIFVGPATTPPPYFTILYEIFWPYFSLFCAVALWLVFTNKLAKPEPT